MTSASDRTELDSRPQGSREWSGYLRSLILPLALVVAIVGGLILWQNSRSEDALNDGYGTVALPDGKNPTGKDPNPVAGRAAPDFLLPSIEGTPLQLSDLQGKPVLVNFWATWCVSCRAEMPELIQTYETHRADGLVVLGVNLREADDRVGDFASEFGVSYPLLMDHSGEVARTWRIGGPTSGLPSSYFIDAHGVVQKVVYGTLTDKDLADGLRLILGSSR
jgi:peroxiredoxin